jgi:formate hydrogenlyase subunit 3/multisubunit Na+/H+ antiporter MnhD subunit
MGIGAAVLCFAAGAILYYAIEVDLPYVDDNTLGAILLLAGVIAAIAALIATTRRSAGGTSTGTGVGLMVAGAIVYWAIDIDFPFVTDGALGVILMFAGIVTVVATLFMHRQDTRDRRTMVPSPRDAYDHPGYDDPYYRRRHHDLR